MNKKNYKPVFIDHQRQEKHFKIFGVKSYEDLVMYLEDKNIYDEKDYGKLVDMVKTMIVSKISSAFDSYSPEIKRDFFQIPQDTFIQKIYKEKLYKDDAYVYKISNFDYKKIDELIIDHINFLLLEHWRDKYDKIEEIIGKISDQISKLQQNFPDKKAQEKIIQSYIIHFINFMTKTLSGLSLGKLDMYSEKEYEELSDDIHFYEEYNKDIVFLDLKNKEGLESMNEDEKNLLLERLNFYKFTLMQKYHELTAISLYKSVIYGNEISELLLKILKVDNNIIVLEE